jgi:hypothetical protein
MKPSLPFLPALETLLAPRIELTLQLCDKGERFRSQDFRKSRRYLSQDVHARG